jgi:PPOX class probable FMN-dependent enzyme
MSTATSHSVTNLAVLRERYAQPNERAVKKLLPHIDRHMRSFIALSPFVVMGTAGSGGADVTPRGDEPGFVRVLDDTTLLLPDWPGNNRLDSLGNVLANPHVGLLFLVPGVDETLRVNGVAEITVDPDLLARWERGGKQPKSVLRITVREAFLHCAKALMRSRLWSDEYRVERTALPSYGHMLKDQIDCRESADEIQTAVVESYRNKLY